MPRDGAYTYSVPGGTDGVPDTPVYSTPYNGFLRDLEQDLNTPRPIVAGGTGATNKRDAMIALSGEFAGQLVDNYDSFPFIAGSFWSAPGATLAPDAASRFSGVCLPYSDPAYMTIEARSYEGTAAAPTSQKYTRQKIAGTWSAWVLQAGPKAEIEKDFVNVAGDVMTGHLSLPITPAADNAVRRDYVDAADALRVAKAGDTMTGHLSVPTNPAAANAVRKDYVDAADAALSASLSGSINNKVTRTGDTMSGQLVLAMTSWHLMFRDTTTGWQRYWGMQGDRLYQFNNGFTAAIGFTDNVGNNYAKSWGNIADPAFSVWIDETGSRKVQFNAGTDVYSSSGDGHLHLRSNGPAGLCLRVQTDGNFTCYGQAYKPGGGGWIDNSDARIKNVEGNYTRGLEEIAQLQPVVYTFKGNDTDKPPSNFIGQEDYSREVPSVPYPNSLHATPAKAGKKFAGLIAQDIEAIFPEMVSKSNGYIDGAPVNDLRGLDTNELVFALINAVKELKERLEALEAA